MKIYFILFFSSLCIVSYAQHPWLVKDININHPVNQLADGTSIGEFGCKFGENEINQIDSNAGPSTMFKVGSFALFFATDGKSQKGLWRSNGTKNGTYFISALNAKDSQRISISDVYSTGSLLYFTQGFLTLNRGTGTDDYHFVAIWRSDGTTAGTFPIFSGDDKTINFIVFNTSNSNASPVIGNNFYFIGSQQIADTVYTNLYKTDGTVAGTHIYFQLDKQKGDITNTYSERTISNIISFNNHIYFNYNSSHKNTGYEIWVGDGINSPQELCDFNPGLLGTEVYSWVNLNDKYLVVYSNLETSNPDVGTPEILSINAKNDCPAVIDNAISSASFYEKNSVDAEAAIVGDKFFFEKATVSGSRAIEVTDGTKNGTIASFLDSASGINGICTKGAIISTYNIDNNKTYIWNGGSPSSYHIFSDSLNANESYNNLPYKILQFDSTLLIFTKGEPDIVWQTDVNGSYCYRVATLHGEKGVKLSDTSYLALGYDINGVFDAGTEPFIFKKFDKVWTGKLSSDWGNKNNWLPAGVPAYSQDVIIPPVANNPVINSSAACKDLVIYRYGSIGSYITINQSVNLDVHGFVYNNGDIKGAGSITRKGTFANTTYGNGSYNVDSININGADWDLTSMNFAYPNSVAINSVINFKSDNKLIMNEISLVPKKAPFFTGFNNKRYVVDNRIYPSWYNTDSSLLEPFTIELIDFSGGDQDSAITIPFGTSTSSYTPLTFTYPVYDPHYISAYVTGEVKKNGNTGDLITTGVVNKTWVVADEYGTVEKFEYSWTANDETPGFNHNACFVAYYDGSKWIKGTTQATVFKNGLYSISIEQTGGFPENLTSYIICSDFNLLPVSFTNFTVQLTDENAKALLRWQTATEINSLQYNIKRSLDGMNFSTIGKVDAAGNSTSLKTYSFTDNISKLGGNVIYYQIEEVDKDGKATLSQIRTINKSSQDIFIVFPNPVKDIINIGGSNLQQIQIFNESGKLLQQTSITTTSGGNNIKIDVSKYAQGVYLIKAINDKKQEQIRKFLKQ